MLQWLISNLATIIISLALILIVGLIIRGMIKNRRAGKSSCGCECGDCPMSGQCHVK